MRIIDVRNVAIRVGYLDVSAMPNISRRNYKEEVFDDYTMDKS
jgi:hypothetical protein